MKSLVFFYLTICYYGSTQITFQKSFGGLDFDASYCVQQTSDDGYVLLGKTKSFGTGSDDDIYLIRTNVYGDTVWTKTFGGTGYETGRSIQETVDGGYIVCADNSNSLTGARLLKINSIGDTTWTRTYMGWGYSVQHTSDGGYMMAGSAYFGAGGWNLNLIKTSTTGDALWSKSYGGWTHDYGYSGLQTNDGGFIVVGSTESFGSGGKDVYVIKTDSDGNLLWSKTYGETAQDVGESIIQTSEGGYIIVGTSYSHSWDQLSPDMNVIKIDSLGNVEWSKRYGGFICYTLGKDILETPDGDFAVIGYTGCDGNQGEMEQGLVVKINSAGEMIWAKGYGEYATDGFYSIDATSDNGFIMSGLTSSFGSGGADVYLLKTDSSFNSLCFESVPYISDSLVTMNSTVPTTVVDSAIWYANYPTITISSGGITDTMCFTLGVEEFLDSDSKCTIYPNPFSINTTLITSTDLQNATLLVYDVYGNEQKNVTNIYTSSITLNRENLQNGVYFLILIQNGEIISKNKLIITN